MRIRQLEYFVALAEALHFTRAAKSVGVSQPVLSSQIRALETELGAALLTRTSRHVDLTPAGASFLIDARLVLGQLEAAIQKVHKTAETTLLVGTYTGGMYMEKPIIEACKASWPEVEITLVMLGWGEIAAAVRRGQADVAFLRLPQDRTFPAHDGLMITRLHLDPRVVIMTEDHPLAGRSQVTLRDLTPYPVVAPGGVEAAERNWWMVNPRPDGSVVAQGRTAAGIAELLDLVSISQEIAITTQSVGEAQARPGITHVPVIDADPGAIALAWNSETANPSVRRFVQIAKATGASDTGEAAVG